MCGTTRNRAIAGFGRVSGCRSFFAIADSSSSFYSNEGTPREPIHIHVEKEADEAKFWLYPEVSLAYNDGYNDRTLRDLLAIIDANRNLIVRTWNEYFG
jgi:hypothetical protein